MASTSCDCKADSQSDGKAVASISAPVVSNDCEAAQGAGDAAEQHAHTACIRGGFFDQKGRHASSSRISVMFLAAFRDELKKLARPVTSRHVRTPRASTQSSGKQLRCHRVQRPPTVNRRLMGSSPRQLATCTSVAVRFLVASRSHKDARCGLQLSARRQGERTRSRRASTTSGNRRRQTQLGRSVRTRALVLR